jgi:hypothetical protein
MLVSRLKFRFHSRIGKFYLRNNIKILGFLSSLHYLHLILHSYGRNVSKIATIELNYYSLVHNYILYFITFNHLLSLVLYTEDCVCSTLGISLNIHHTVKMFPINVLDFIFFCHMLAHNWHTKCASLFRGQHSVDTLLSLHLHNCLSIVHSCMKCKIHRDNLSGLSYYLAAVSDNMRSLHLWKLLFVA